MKLILHRNWLVGDTTSGRLYIKEDRVGSKLKFHSFTLEDKVRNEKIHGKTAIPYGKYPIEITKSTRFGRMMPLIKNVEGFDGVRIHTGNTAIDTSGCLLVGKELTKDGKRLINSRGAYSDLNNKISEAIKKGEKVTMEIVAPYKKKIVTIGLGVLGLGFISTSAYLVYKNFIKKQQNG
jgi:hypothetical protein